MAVAEDDSSAVVVAWGDVSLTEDDSSETDPAADTVRDQTQQVDGRQIPLSHTETCTHTHLQTSRRPRIRTHTRTHVHTYPQTITDTHTRAQSCIVPTHLKTTNHTSYTITNIYTFTHSHSYYHTYKYTHVYVRTSCISTHKHSIRRTMSTSTLSISHTHTHTHSILQRAQHPHPLSVVLTRSRVYA